MICAQLILVCVVGCYLLNSFQNKVILALHNISHQLIAKEYFQKDSRKSGLELSQEYHGHSHSELHEHSHSELHGHEALSFIQTILDFGDLEDPFTKHKKDFKVDKHIIPHYLSDNRILLKRVQHEYGYAVFIVNSPCLKLKGPPPRFMVG